MGNYYHNGVGWSYRSDMYDDMRDCNSVEAIPAVCDTCGNERIVHCRWYEVRMIKCSCGGHYRTKKEESHKN